MGDAAVGDAAKGDSVLVIGCGNMGGAIVKGLIRGGMQPRSVVAYDLDGDRLSVLQGELGVFATTDLSLALSRCNTAVLALKPQVVKGFLPRLAELLSPSQGDFLLVSVVAGLELSEIRDFLGTLPSLVRVMPNLPCAIGAGLSLVYAEEGTALDFVRGLFSTFSMVIELKEEAEFHVMTSLCGSGPAYVFLFAEAMADAALKMGVDRERSRLLASQLIFGSAKMLLESGQHPAYLKDMVSSPGGTTISGLCEMERLGFRHAVVSAVESGAKRSASLLGS